MKKNARLKTLLALLSVMLSFNVWSQSTPATSATEGGTAAASGGTTAQSARRANRALRRSVYAALAKHKEIDAGSISIVAKNGVLTLNGTVPDASQIEAVEQIAKGVAGVTSLTNKLTVQRPFGQ